MKNLGKGRQNKKTKKEQQFLSVYHWTIALMKCSSRKHSMLIFNFALIQ